MTIRFGACPICFSLSAAFTVLGMLVYALGASLPLFPLAMAGLAVAAGAGLLTLLHAGFYLARGEQALPPMIVRRVGSRPAPPRRSCCGGWG